MTKAIKLKDQVGTRSFIAKAWHAIWAYAMSLFRLSLPDMISFGRFGIRGVSLSFDSLRALLEKLRDKARAQNNMKLVPTLIPAMFVFFH